MNETEQRPPVPTKESYFISLGMTGIGLLCIVLPNTLGAIIGAPMYLLANGIALMFGVSLGYQQGMYSQIGGGVFVTVGVIGFVVFYLVRRKAAQRGLVVER